MSYDYTYVIETIDHVYLRYQPDDYGDPAGELDAGYRLQAAQPIVGGDYGGSGAGNEWYPVLYQQVSGGDMVECFLAKGYAIVI